MTAFTFTFCVSINQPKLIRTLSFIGNLNSDEVSDKGLNLIQLLLSAYDRKSRLELGGDGLKRLFKRVYGYLRKDLFIHFNFAWEFYFKNKGREIS